MQKKVVVEKDGAKKDITFRKILLYKCQKEFEKEKSIAKKIQEKLEDLTKQGLSVSTYYSAFNFEGFSEYELNNSLRCSCLAIQTFRFDFRSVSTIFDSIWLIYNKNDLIGHNSFSASNQPSRFKRS